jgi:Carbohydrate esterase, sialic acid-specific acetylesterase/Concanavalin A-like lectin/glucanases superfamily
VPVIFAEMNTSTLTLINQILSGNSNLIPSLARRIDQYNDVGTEIVLLIGQSNMSGHSTNVFDANIDFSDPAILQRPPVGTYANREILAIDPLWHHDRQAQGCVGLGLSFAKTYTRYSNKRLLLLPQAQGGTGFNNNFWNVGNTLYNSAVSNTNAALATNPKSKLTAILWHQGENDVNYRAEQYLSNLILMIRTMRNAITNGANVPFLLGELAPTWVAGNSNRQSIQNVITQVPQLLPNCHLVSSANLAVDGTGIHFTGAAYRSFGVRYAEVLISAIESNQNLLSGTLVPILSNAGVSGVTVAWNLIKGILEYQIKYRDTNSTNWEFTRVTGVTSTVINRLKSNTYYEFQVVAIGDGNTVKSESRFVQTLAPVTLPTPLLDLRFKGNYADSSPNNFTATSQGAVLITNDLIRGQVLSVNPNGTSTNGGLNIPCGCPATYTKMVWVLLNNITTVNQNIISSEAASAANYLWFPTEGRINFGQLAAFNLIQAPVGQFIYPNIWTHIACTFSSGVAQLFLNGELIGSASGVAAFPGLAAPNLMGIGCSNGFGTAMTGRLSNAKIYSAALTATQIREIYYQEFLLPSV